MIRNIPNKYNITILRQEIDTYYSGNYDFLYLPLDSTNGCNVGYAFINLLHPLQILSFVEIFKGKMWKKFNSNKQCEISYAKYQGKKDFITQFMLMSNLSEEKRPFVVDYAEDFINNIEVPKRYLEKFKSLYPRVIYSFCEGNAMFSFNSKEHSCN